MYHIPDYGVPQTEELVAKVEAETTERHEREGCNCPKDDVPV